MQKKEGFKRVLSIIVGIVLLLVTIFLVREFMLGPKDENIFDDEIRIGLIAPLSGSSTAGGEEMKRGVELAVNNINKSGGIAGHKLSLITYDDKSDPEETIKAAKSLIFLDRVEAIIGPFSSDSSLAIMGIINNLGIPMITPVAMADEINIADDYVFRNTLGASMAQKKVNDFVKGQGRYILLDGFDAKTIGIIWQNDTWGSEMAELVRLDLERIEKQDTLLFSESFSLGEDDFSKLFKKYKHNYPDIIYVVSSGKEAIEIVKSGRNQGYTGLFYGEGGFNSVEFDKELGEYANGCLFSSQWHPYFSTPMSDVFLTSYMHANDGVPNMFAAISYEAVYILKESFLGVIGFIERDDFNELLRQRIADTGKISGITGNIYMDKNGQCSRPMFILQKRWTGMNIQSVIIYPKKYSQGDLIWDFTL